MFFSKKTLTLQNIFNIISSSYETHPIFIDDYMSYIHILF